MNGSAVDESSPYFSYTEFTPVKSRKKRKNKKTNESESRPSSTVLLQQVRDALTQDPWLSQCQNIVNDSLQSLSCGYQYVLCLGLGSPSTSSISRAQLAFLIELCDKLNIDHANVSIYDPVFTQEDQELFKQLHFKVLSENKNADYPLERPTICYMPHCDMELYESLLRANWTPDRLLKVVLIANRLEDYLENNSHQKLKERVPLLITIAPLLVSHHLPPSMAWPTAFSNTCLQYASLSENQSADLFSTISSNDQVTDQ